MNRTLLRRGFTTIELLTVVGMLAALGSVASVSMGLGSPSTAARRSVAQPEDAGSKRIEKIRKQLDSMKKQIETIETELDELQKEKAAANPGALGKARAAARQLKDATQVRGIQQSLVVWANQNKGSYPLPSKMDAAGSTLAGAAESKDTTANIFSTLIFNGYISTEICISPAEANANIKAAPNYQFDRPPTAKNPEQALWDPAFSADFTNGKTGNVSYAHLQPFGGRLKTWSDTFNTTEAIVGNRGPEISAVDRANGAKIKIKNASSNTFLIHGERDTWEGNIAFNDGHVNFETVLVGDIDKGWPAYVNKEGKRVADVLFFDEKDCQEPEGNLYLSIFTKSGKTLEDWTAIWD